ncbi:MAG: hypothetical protein GPJ54_08385 [Candidatus Heimdallarchaeota archaeon]|nr:hypothetical protein [Candidatus Heimdallarchaeota archaeon]
MATRTTNKKIQLTGWPSFNQVSKMIATLLEKMNNIFSSSDDNISQTLSEIREEQLTKFDSGLMTMGYLYSRRI